MTDLKTARERFRQHMDDSNSVSASWPPFGVDDRDFADAPDNGNGITKIVNVKLGKGRKSGAKPGQRMITWATVLLFVLAGGLFVISWWAQFRYVFDVKHQHMASIIEASALDLGQVIFSLLALGMARAGMSAKMPRLWVIVCALGSAVMNYAAADVHSPRSVLAYVVPPIFLAIVIDQVVTVVRRHVLGEKHESAWTAAGTAARKMFRFMFFTFLYGLRVVLAPAPTARGMRAWVLNVTPLPDAVPVITDKPKAVKSRIRPPADRKALLPPNGPRGPRTDSKTARFIARVIEVHGPLAEFPVDQAAKVAKELHGDLNEGQARKVLRERALEARS